MIFCLLFGQGHGLLVEVFAMSFFWSVLLREADQKEWPVCFLLQDTTLNSAGLVLARLPTAVPLSGISRFGSTFIPKGVRR